MSSKDIFSPEMQESFWKNVDPDAIDLLSLFEERESWTLDYEELPDFYREMADIIPEIKQFTKSGSPSDNFIERLVQLLSSMSLKNNVAALVWLDSGLESEITIGWSTIVYRHCESAMKNDTSNENAVKCAKIVTERIQLMVRLKLLVSVFCSGGKINV
jgi:hypothetical protein